MSQSRLEGRFSGPRQKFAGRHAFATRPQFGRCPESTFLLARCMLYILCMLDRVAGQIERYMDLLSVRQKLVASNIANADTPGHPTRDGEFQGAFHAGAR